MRFAMLHGSFPTGNRGPYLDAGLEPEIKQPRTNDLVIPILAASKVETETRKSAVAETVEALALLQHSTRRAQSSHTKNGYPSVTLFRIGVKQKMI